MPLRITTSSSNTTTTRISRSVPDDFDSPGVTVGAIIPETRSEKRGEAEDEARNSDEETRGEKEDGGSARVERRSGGMASVKELRRGRHGHIYNTLVSAHLINFKIKTICQIIMHSIFVTIHNRVNLHHQR